MPSSLRTSHTFQTKLANSCYSQQKFKKLIESTGRYALVNGKVVDLEDDDGGPPATPARRGRGFLKGTSTPRSGATRGRKRKATKDVTDDEDDSEGGGTPVKKRATPAKRGAARKAAEKVREEASEEAEEDGEEEQNGEGEKSTNDDDGDEAGDGDGDGDGDGGMGEEEI